MQTLYYRPNMDDLAVGAIGLGRQLADRARSVYLGDNAKEVAFVARCFAGLKERQPFNQADEGGYYAVKDILERCIASELLGMDRHLEEIGYDEFGPRFGIRETPTYSERGNALIDLQTLFQKFMKCRNDVLDQVAAHRCLNNIIE